VQIFKVIFTLQEASVGLSSYLRVPFLLSFRLSACRLKHLSAEAPSGCFPYNYWDGPIRLFGRRRGGVSLSGSYNRVLLLTSDLVSGLSAEPRSDVQVWWHAQSRPLLSSCGQTDASLWLDQHTPSIDRQDGGRLLCHYVQTVSGQPRCCLSGFPGVKVPERKANLWLSCSVSSFSHVWRVAWSQEQM
jgi:hypothetical protein